MSPKWKVLSPIRSAARWKSSTSRCQSLNRRSVDPIRSCCCATLQQAGQGYGHYGLIWILGLLVPLPSTLGFMWGIAPLSHPLPDICSRWGCIGADFANFAQFGPTSSLEPLSSPTRRPPSSTSLLVSTLVIMAETSQVWLPDQLPSGTSRVLSGQESTSSSPGGVGCLPSRSS